KSSQKPDQLLLKFFKPSIPQNALLVPQLSPIHTPKTQSSQLLTPKNDLKVAVTRLEEAVEAASDVCQSTVELLVNLHVAIERIPDDKPQATTEHQLFPFGENPAKSIESDAEEVQKSCALYLNACICGSEVSKVEINKGDTVMQCKVLGCETQWYHCACMNYDFAPKSWLCPGCKGSSAASKHCCAK
ncbi:hypothetical protein L208DRAFT_1236736, partial [Tricholoma matsutake]